MTPTNAVPRRTGARALALTGSLALTAALTGCGVGGNSAATTSAPALGANVISGSVHGGQQGIAGATIQLYAAGIPGTGSGYGVGATPLLTSSVVTDNSGSFGISGKYTCPTPTQQVYIVATGGNPGLTTPAAGAGQVNNTGIAEMAVLGPCPAGSTLAATIPFISISEVTTVAAVTALQQFMAAPSAANHSAPNIGAPTTTYATGTTVGAVQSAVLGMNNAFVTAKVLADPTTGLSPNANYPYATPESAKINTIADILSYCINTNGTDGACTSLFTAATPSGRFAAADTIQVAWYMAQNPINNLTNLYNFIPASPPYLPTQLAPGTLNTNATAPATNAFNDTTIAINYAPVNGTASSVGAPYGIAIDAYGNAWVSNAGGINGVAASAVELGVDGSAITTPATTYPASATGGSTGQFTTAPTAASTRTFTAPKQVAIDLANRAWISNYGDAYAATTAATTSSLGVFTGSTAAGSGGTGGGTGSTGFFVGSGPQGIAIDGTNTVFVVNSTSQAAGALDGSSIASLISSPGTANDGGSYAYSTSTTATAPNRTPGGTNSTFLAIDTNTNVTGGIVWAGDANACKVTGQYNAATYFGTLSMFNDTSLAPLAGSDAVSALSNAVVGAGSTTNCGSTSTYVGQTFTAGANNLTGVAIDRNNGVWITDLNTSSTGFDGLTYLSAPTASTGIIPTSFALVNGVAPNATNAAVAGTTLKKAGAVAVDGNNNAWIGNQSAASVVEATFNGSNIILLTPGQGSAYGSTGAAYGIGFQHNTATSLGVAIDASGNVWVANNSTGTNTYTNQAAGTTNVGNSVTVIVGAAGPVITPLALAIKSNKLGTKP